MAERSQYQYVQVVGPVWREPVAEKLAWLPSDRYAGRPLPPNRLGDFASPVFEALYKPSGLEWIPSDRYAGRPREYALTRYIVIDPIPPVDPAWLSWFPRDSYFGRKLPSGRYDYTVAPPSEPLYKSAGLEWSPSGQPFPRTLLPNRFISSAFDPFPRLAIFDPQTLDWMPRGSYPRILLELRRIGDFQQPSFDALYKPEFLQWLFPGQGPARWLPPAQPDRWIIDPTVLLPIGPSPAGSPYIPTFRPRRR